MLLSAGLAVFLAATTKSVCSAEVAPIANARVGYPFAASVGFTNVKALG